MIIFTIYALLIYLSAFMLSILRPPGSGLPGPAPPRGHGHGRHGGLPCTIST